jgi:hypothetical protein
VRVDHALHAHLIDEMELSLDTLAARWRSRQQTPEAAEIVRRYQAILRCMIALGFHESLGAETELPERLMPEEYVALFKA